MPEGAGMSSLEESPRRVGIESSYGAFDSLRDS